MQYPAGVYYLRKQDNVHYIEPDIERFTLPKKLYGNVEQLALRFWNTFAVSEKSIGVILTGNSGSGKTEQAQVTANIAIDCGLPVIVVTDINADIDTVKYINGVTDAVILFDEFSKNFNMQLQEKMLTMLSGINRTKKLFFITENNKHTISSFIRSRPGRALYRIDYSRIEESIITEYCADYNVDPKFHNDLKNIYKKSIVFSFDHLQALVKEHLAHPNDSLEYLLTILNLDILTKDIMYIVKEIRNTDNEPVEFNPYSFPKDRFDKNGREYISLKDYTTISISGKDVISIDNDKVTCRSGNGLMVLLVSDDGSFTGEAGTSGPQIEDLFYST
jgi:hypothetical protein